LIKKLNERRNWIQHHAESVSKEYLDEAKVNAKDFLEEVYRSFFNFEFEALNEMHFVSDESLRELLLMAKELSETSQERKIGLVCLWIAFKAAFDSWAETYDLLNTGKENALGNPAEDYDYDDLMLMHFSNINPFDYHRFRTVLPVVNIALAGNLEIDYVASEESYSLDYEFKQGFVLNSIMTWQRIGLRPQYKLPAITIESLREMAGSTAFRTAR
jgi:hypothetical protein